MGLLQRRRQGRRRILLRPEGLKHDPAALVGLLQPGQQPRPEQRRLSAPRGAQDQQQPGLALGHLIDRFSQGAEHTVLPKEHRRMAPIKALKPRKRRSPRRPGQAALPAQRLQALQQALPAGLGPLLQINHRQRRGLGFAQQLWEGAASDDTHRKHQLARRHRHPQLRQAPLRLAIGLAADHDHRRAELQVLIKLIPPALAGLDAVIGIKVEKQRSEALLLRPLLLLIL